MGIPCWHFSHLLRKRKWCLSLPPRDEGTDGEHFLWGCPSAPAAWTYWPLAVSRGLGNSPASAWRTFKVEGRDLSWQSHWQEALEAPPAWPAIPHPQSGPQKCSDGKSHTLCPVPRKPVLAPECSVLYGEHYCHSRAWPQFAEWWEVALHHPIPIGLLCSRSRRLFMC